MADNKIGFGKRIVVSAAGTPVGGAMLEIEKDKQTDMIFHLKTDKIIYVLHGQVKVRVLKDGQINALLVKPGVSFFVRAGVVHQLEAVEQSVVLEFVSDTELYKESVPDEDTHVISPGTKREVVPIPVSEGEFATMTEEDEAKTEPAPKPKRTRRPTKKKKPAAKKKTPRKRK